MATESIGTARVDVVVDTSQFDTAIQAAKRSVSDMSTSAQQAYNQLDAKEKRRVDRLIHQANTIGFSKDQQIAYNAALRTQGPILDEITRKLAQNNNQVQRAGVELNKYGVSARQQAAALRGVPAQMTDIFIGLQGGQNPLTVLLQQGGQLKDMFGGIVPAARALGGAVMGLINPFTLGAAAIAGLVIALEQASSQANAFERAMIMTGNVANTSAGELAGFAKELDGLAGVTQREASAVLAEVASTGQFTSEQIMLVASAALQMQEATGKAVSETIAEFVQLKKDPVDAILELNSKYHFLTEAQAENILSLKEQGREIEASAAAIEDYAAVIDDRAPRMAEQIGMIAAAWRGVKNTASEAWDGIVTAIDTHGDRVLQVLSWLPGSAFGARAIRNLADKGREGTGTGGASAGRPGPIVDSAAWKREQEERRKAEEQFGRLAVSNLSKQEKLEREIKEIRELGLKAGKSEAEIEKQIAQARARYAESLPKGRKARTETDPTDAILARVRQQIALNEEQARSEGALTASERLRVQVLHQIEELGAKVAPQRRAEIEALLDTAVATDKLVQAKKAEAQAQKDLAALTAQLAVAEQNYRRQVEADLATIGRGGDAVEMLRRQLDLQRELEDGLDAIRRDSTGKSKEALEAEEQALRDSIDRRLEIERGYWQRRQEMMADWRNGARAAIEDYLSSAQDVAGQTYDIIDGAFSGMEDLAVDFFKKGEADWRAYLDSINENILRFIVRQQLSKIGEKLLPGLGGGQENGDKLLSAAGALSASAAPLSAAAAALTGAAAALAAAGAGSALAGATGSGGWGELFQGLGSLGYWTGGYTGDGLTRQPAGIVHRGEYVINAAATRALGVSNLDRLNSGGSLQPVVAPQTFNFSVSGSIDHRSAYRISLDAAQKQRMALARS